MTSTRTTRPSTRTTSGGISTVSEVAVGHIDTPIGTLVVAATSVGIVHVAYPCTAETDVMEMLATTVGPLTLDTNVLDAAAAQIGEYFGGTRSAFTLPLDWRLSTGFGRMVHQHIAQIGYGETASYKDVAEWTGKPLAARAVGTACGANPLPVLVPCHRVVRSDGTLGGFGGGLEIKRALLDLERAHRDALSGPAAASEVPPCIQSDGLRR